MSSKERKVYCIYMAWSDSHEEMSWTEKHGILLRLHTDYLVERTDDLLFDSMAAVFTAEALLAAVQAANQRLQSGDLDI